MGSRSRAASGVRFHVTATTLGSWKVWIDEHGPNALLQIQMPVNKFPDLGRYIVRRLKPLGRRLGKVKIAEMLCRAGLHLAPTTVGTFRSVPSHWMRSSLPGRSSKRNDPMNCGTSTVGG